MTTAPTEFSKRLLERGGDVSRAEVLVLGPGGDALRAELEARGAAVHALHDASRIEFPPGRFDLVVAPGLLEATEWHRWALQQAHFVMKDGGRLLITAPNMLSLASAGDVFALVSRAASRVARKFARRASRPKPRRWAYRATPLVETIESLGFEIEHMTVVGRGLIAPVAALAPVLGRRFGQRFEIVARKRPSAVGLLRHGGYPPCAQHIQSFEAIQRRFLEIRADWLRRNPALAPGPARAIDPQSFRGRQVLVLAPHPDDEIIGCGGTLLRMIRSGARVTCVQATDGAASLALMDAPAELRRTIRIEEARRVSAAIGFARLECWNEPNGAFQLRDETVGRLRALIHELRPAVIFTPFITDIHDEHLVLNRILGRALEGTDLDADTAVLCYEVWSLVPAGRYCDVLEVTREQEDLLRLYVTAMKVDDFVHFCEARNFHHACRLTGANGFAEAFYEVPAARFPDFLETVQAAPAGP